MSARYIVAVADSTELAKVINKTRPGNLGLSFQRDTNIIKLLDPDGSDGAYLNIIPLDANLALPATSLVALGGGSTATKTGGQVGNIVDITNAASGTVQSTEYTLNSVVLPASAFNAATRGITVSAWLQLAANGNAKNIKIYFGSVAVCTVTGSTANAKDVFITMTVVRLAASSQSAVATIQVDTGTAPTMATTVALTEDETAAITIAVKTANTAAAAASGTGRGMVVSFGN